MIYNNKFDKNFHLDVISYAQQLKDSVILKNHKTTLFERVSDHQAKCNQLLGEVTQDLEILTQLNQPKYQLPDRIKRLFPFCYSNKLRQFLLRCYNFAVRPQQKINAQIHLIALNTFKASQLLLLEQKKQHSEMQQQITNLENQVLQLHEALTQHKNSNNLTEDEHC